MPNYLLMLYSPEVGPAEQAEREAELPLWFELNESLKEAGLLIDTGRLHPVSAATTVRVRGGETELTDGPFAVTKEILAATSCSSAATSTRRSSRPSACRSHATGRLRCGRSWT